jgi:hypothetical protein
VYETYDNPDDPRRIQDTEQMWAQATEHVDSILAFVRRQEPLIYAKVGGNTDISVLFDWFKAYIQVAENQGGQEQHNATIVICAAALTRLMRQDDLTDARTVLAQLERDMTDDDDH